MKRGRRHCTVAGLLLLTAACGSRQNLPNTDTAGRQTIAHDGRSRSYLLRLPASLRSGGAAVPLVLVLHGGGGNGANAEAMTGFTPLAQSAGFVVAYPEGTARGQGRLLTWNAGHCCGFALQARIDDVGFLRALIDDLLSRYPIDPARVYVTGMSNGAMMTHRVGIELADRLAAIAPVAGAVFGNEQPGRAGVSALMINGMLDRSVPYEGGAPGGLFADSWDGTPVRPALDQATFWARANGCSPTAVTTTAAAYIHVRHDCGGRRAVELYAVKDIGHAWPGGQRGSALGDPPGQTLHATQIIWAFFSAHPK